MTVLVLAEHDNRHLHDATRRTLTAARQLGPVSVLVAGQDCRAVAEQAAELGVARVLLAEHSALAHPLAEVLAPLLARLAPDHTHLLAPADTFGKNILPRAAALLDAAQVSDVVEIIDPETFVRPIHAGNALATVRCPDPVKVLTVRPAAFPPATAEDAAGTIEDLAVDPQAGPSRFVTLERAATERPDPVTARIVVSGGRGIRDHTGLALIEALADRLGAAVGATRSAVDAGIVPNDWQIGQTGKVVAPELYFAIGLSGAIQHLAGMKDSRVIVAINQDPEAPIFEVADYGLVGDLFEVVPRLTEALGG